MRRLWRWIQSYRYPRDYTEFWATQLGTVNINGREHG